jgi:hypothetical protein
MRAERRWQRTVPRWREEIPYPLFVIVRITFGKHSMPLPGFPAMPEDLDPKAAAVWERVAREFGQTGVIRGAHAELTPWLNRDGAAREITQPRR